MFRSIARFFGFSSSKKENPFTFVPSFTGAGKAATAAAAAAQRSAGRSFEESHGAFLDALELLRYLPETHALMQRAEKAGVEILVDEEMKSHAAAASYDSFDNKVRINSSFDAEALPGDIAHELRHFLQRSVMGWPGARENLVPYDMRTARSMVIITRLLEGDAYAFDNLVRAKMEMAKKNKMLGMTPEKSRALLAKDAKINHVADARYLRKAFMQQQLRLDYYDVKKLTEYAGLLVDPCAIMIKNEMPLTDEGRSLRRLREIFRVGVGAESGNYMTGLSDRNLIRSALAPMGDAARQAMWSMDVFDRREEGMPAGQRVERLMEIRERTIRMQSAYTNKA